MTNEYQNNVVALKIIFCAKIAECRKVMIALYETIIWTILGGEKEKWIYHDEPKKELIFSLENEVELDLKESEQMMMICFCSIVSVCQFVKSNEHLRQLFPCLCQFSTLMFPPCCAIGNHSKVSSDVHPTTFCLNFYLHLLQRNSALQRKSGTELKN